MLNKLHIVTLLLSLAVLVTSCCKHGSDEPDTTPINNRTVLVYMLADNNLGYYYDFDGKNIEDMCKSFDNKTIDGRLLIFHAGSDMIPCLKEIYKPQAGQPCEIKILKTYPNTISTDSTTVQKVLDDVKQLAPSSHCGLLLWSHATGWLPQNRLFAHRRTAAPTSFGREGEAELTIDIDVLARALASTHFDFVLFDACLMGSVEVAYEMRNICDYIIATPTETVGEGYPYDKITPLLFDKEVDYKKICDNYFEKISGANYFGGTISLIQTNQLEQLAIACHDIVKVNSDKIYTLNTRRIQSYDNKSTHIFYDLHHYLFTLNDNEQCQALDDALSKAVIHKAATPSFNNLPITHYSGLSCYIPHSVNDTIVEEYYSRLQWYKRLYDTY